MPQVGCCFARVSPGRPSCARPVVLVSCGEGRGRQGVKAGDVLRCCRHWLWGHVLCRFPGAGMSRHSPAALVRRWTP